MADLPLAVLGIDHHRTPVGVRERLAIADSDLGDLLAGLAALPGCSEAVALSTCNRVECYLVGAPDRDQVLSWLCERRGVPPEVVGPSAYWKRGGDAVRHLFRVAAGLESLVIGESQIVHQIKSAYDAALARQSTGAVLNPLFQRALAAGKDVRTQTAIGRHRLSVASVAVELAEHIHGDLSSARLLVVGAGEIAELAVKHLLSAGVRQITLVNRTHERALALAAEVPARVIEWPALPAALAEHDIVVASTAAPHAVITDADVRHAMRHRRAALLMIDLAVPRDIDERVGKLGDVFLYNIDHLESVVAANRALRADEVAVASALVDSLAKTYLDVQAAGQGALLAEVAAYFRDVIASEEARLAVKIAGGTLGGDELRYALERVGNKLQHRLLSWLRAHPGDAAAEAMIREILGLEKPR